MSILFNVYKRFFILVTFLRFLTFFLGGGTFLHVCNLLLPRCNYGIKTFTTAAEKRHEIVNTK